MLQIVVQVVSLGGGLVVVIALLQGVLWMMREWFVTGTLFLTSL